MKTNMLGKCKCGKSLREYSEILLGNCRRCQVAYISGHRAPVFKQKPMKLNKLTKAMLQVNDE